MDTNIFSFALGESFDLKQTLHAWELHKFNGRLAFEVLP